MRRSITRVIMLVTTATVLALGFPLAYVLQRAYHGEAVVRLQRQAALAIGEVTLPLDAQTVASALSEPDDPLGVAVYDQTGTLLTGPGPTRPDRAVARALTGQPAEAVIGSTLVVAVPINDRSTERVVGAVRVTTPEATIWTRTLRAWAAMAAIAATALVGAWIAARRQSRRLARPISALATTAESVTAGQMPTPREPSGIAEVDAVAATLHANTTRLFELLARERTFSSDVSHQLRTPLTRLRLTIERRTASASDDDDSAALLREIDQIEATITHLLALARGYRNKPATTDPNTAVHDATERWQHAVQAQGRQLTLQSVDDLPTIHATAAALDQVLDVLIDNALQHATGAITVRARPTAGGVAIEINDQGPVARDQRTARAGLGIGLSLARTLVHADGGRLMAFDDPPTTYELVYRSALDPDVSG